MTNISHTNINMETLAQVHYWAKHSFLRLFFAPVAPLLARARDSGRSVHLSTRTRWASAGSWQHWLCLALSTGHQPLPRTLRPGPLRATGACREYGPGQPEPSRACMLETSAPAKTLPM